MTSPNNRCERDWNSIDAVVKENAHGRVFTVQFFFFQHVPFMGSSSSSMRAVDVVTTSPAADAATVTIASAKELVDALVCAFCSSTAVMTTTQKECINDLSYKWPQIGSS